MSSIASKENIIKKIQIYQHMNHGGCLMEILQVRRHCGWDSATLGDW